MSQLALVDRILQQLERAPPRAGDSLVISLSDTLNSFDPKHLSPDELHTFENARRRCAALSTADANILDVNLLDRHADELQLVIDLAARQVQRLCSGNVEKEEAKKTIDECARAVTCMRRELLKLKTGWNHADLMLDNLFVTLRRARTKYHIPETEKNDLLLSAVSGVSGL